MIRTHGGRKGVHVDDRGLSAFIKTSHAEPMLTQEQELFYTKAWRDDRSEKASAALVKSHMRLVIRQAMAYGGYGIPLTDLVQEGTVGLMKGIDRFDPERGFRLSTFACHWIKDSIVQYVLNNTSMVSLPRTADGKKLFFNLGRAKARLGAYTPGDLPPETVRAIATQLQVSESSVIEMNRRMSSPVSSLDRTVVGGDGETVSAGILLRDNSDSPEEDFAEREEVDQRTTMLRIAVSELRDRDRDIFKRRNLGAVAETLGQLAEAYGVTRERIRQIEERALRSVRARIAILQAERAGKTSRPGCSAMPVPVLRLLAA